MLTYLQKGLLLAAFFFTIASFDARSEKPQVMPIVTNRAVTAPVKQHLARATWYGRRFFGRTLACGKSYTKDAMFVAHRTYPFGTKLMITNLHNHRSVVVTVEDRGPYVPGRDLDLSYAAAKQLGVISPGVALVSYFKITSTQTEGVLAQ